MIRVFLAVLLGMMQVLIVQLASADEYDACLVKCDQQLADCIARIDTPNDIEIQPLKEQCETNFRTVCYQECADKRENVSPGQQDKMPQEQQKNNADQ